MRDNAAAPMSSARARWPWLVLLVLLTAAELKAQIDDFLGIVEPVHRRKVIFYVTEEAYAAYGTVTQGHELFARELWTRPRWLGDRRWLFWQFDDGGRVGGVEGAIDLDAFRGSADQLRVLAMGSSTP